MKIYEDFNLRWFEFKGGSDMNRNDECFVEIGLHMKDA